MSYRVIVTREGEEWLAEVPDLEGAQTWARNLRNLDQHVREVIVLAADLPDDAEAGLEIAYDFRTGEPMIDEQAARVRAERSELDRWGQSVAADTEEVARWAVAHGYSVRDTAVLAGISYQRVAQVTKQAS